MFGPVSGICVIFSVFPLSCYMYVKTAMISAVETVSKLKWHTCSQPECPCTYGHWFGVGGTEMVKKDGKGDLGEAETSSSPLATCCLFSVVC